MWWSPVACTPLPGADAQRMPLQPPAVLEDRTATPATPDVGTGIESLVTLESGAWVTRSRRGVQVWDTTHRGPLAEVPRMRSSSWYPHGAGRTRPADPLVVTSDGRWLLQPEGSPRRLMGSSEDLGSRTDMARGAPHAPVQPPVAGR